MRIHHPAVWLAAVVHWIAGGLWYGMFRGPFARYVGEPQLQELATHSEALAFMLAFLSSLILVHVLAHVLRTTDSRTIADGVKAVLPLWLGCIAATQSLTVLFEGRHVGLYLLNVGYQFVACAGVVAILVTWRPRVEEVSRA